MPYSIAPHSPRVPHPQPPLQISGEVQKVLGSMGSAFSSSHLNGVVSTLLGQAAKEAAAPVPTGAMS